MEPRAQAFARWFNGTLQYCGVRAEDRARWRRCDELDRGSTRTERGGGRDARRGPAVEPCRFCGRSGFLGVMALQTRLVARCEVRNKRAREEVARGYYEVRLLFLFFF